MATSAGWATLGNAIAGGNKLNTELAYDQGQALGARTADALSQARSRIDENNARAGLDASLKAQIPDDGERAGYVALIQSHADPAQLANARKVNQETGFRNDIVNPATSDTDVARRAFALNQKGPIQQIGEGQVVNELHPVDPTSGAPAVVPTAIGTAIAAQHTAAAGNQNAEAALNRDKVAHPGNYRTGVVAALPPGAAADDGSKALPNDATLLSIARGNSPAPVPGSLNYNRLGGESAMRRVEWFARNPDAVVGGPPPAAAPVAPNPTPGAVQTPAPVGAPPAAGAAAPGDIQLPPATPKAAAAPAGQGSTFDSTAIAQRRTAQNDLARKNGTGGADDALNRVAGHLDVYKQLMDQSGNTNFVASNKLKNWFAQETGQGWPGSAALAAQVLSTEIIKSMANNSIGGVEERTDLAKRFANSNSPGAAADAIGASQKLLREQAVATNQRITAAGIKDYYGKYLTPTTRRQLSLAEFDPVNAPAGAGPPAAGPPPAAGGGLPPQALAALKEGAHTKFANGQTWTLQGGKPVQVP